MIIGAGGASVMDCAKLIAFGACNEVDFKDYLKGEKSSYDKEKLPLILIPTYPSSGSEYGLGAVWADARTQDFGTAYGIAADIAILSPKYSIHLGAELTAYAGLVSLVQLSASSIGDWNPVSYDMGVCVMRNVLKALHCLKQNPQDVDAFGVILYGAALSTSDRLGLGKEQNYAYEIYELEFIPEVLYQASYRKSLTTLFPRFLKAMAKRYEKDIKRYFSDVFGYTGEIDESVSKMINLFESFGVNMYFQGKVSVESLKGIDYSSTLEVGEVERLIKECLSN